MIPCTCARPAIAFVNSVVSAVRALESVRGAATLLRNGGAELALKSNFLCEFESQLNCVAVTERKRLDLLLVCRACRGSWTRAEFKHHFISQLTEVDERAEEAARQLRSSESVATHSFYVHLIVSLAAPIDSELRQVHDSVVTDYKRFTANNVSKLGDAASNAAWVQLEPSTASTGELRDEWDPTASARLHAWVKEL